MPTNKASAMKLILLLCSLVCIANCNAEKITNDNPRACKSPSGDNPLTFEVLPGMGWDNIAEHILFQMTFMLFQLNQAG